jgi:hypothetical protein
MMSIPPFLIRQAEPQGPMGQQRQWPDDASVMMATGEMKQAGWFDPPRVYNHAAHSRWRNG